MFKEILWQRVRLPEYRDCIPTDVDDESISLRESGSDFNFTIRRDLIAGLVPADASRYGGLVKCWTIQLA